MLLTTVLTHGYLLIAMPQSSSTSLMSTLSESFNVAATQRMFCRYVGNAKRSFGFEGLSEHSDTCALTERTLHEFTSNTRIYKQHIVPNKHNLDLIRSNLNRSRIVLLFRNVRDSLHARCERALHEKQPKTKEWLVRRYDSLHRWNDTWYSVEHPNIMKVSFDDLSRNLSTVVHDVARFWNVPIARSPDRKRARLVNTTHEACRWITKRRIGPRGKMHRDGTICRHCDTDV